ncbi:MAG: dienelactone hydrolase family protein, partial [Candidatus Nanohaloarchaea archaeon]|nr:dienelactone hydrolase family protein [Candidatus Nanohaloarchaea archaeon]
MPQTSRVSFRNSRDMELVGLVTHPEGVDHDDDAEQRPGVILCHSFTGYKEVPHLKAIAEGLADRGLVALRFDFSDCVGESDGTCEDMKLTNQITDLIDAINYLESRGEVDPDCIGVAGHSLGGMTVLMAAAR